MNNDKQIMISFAIDTHHSAKNYLISQANNKIYDFRYFKFD